MGKPTDGINVCGLAHIIKECYGTAHTIIKAVGQPNYNEWGSNVSKELGFRIVVSKVNRSLYKDAFQIGCNSKKQEGGHKPN